MKRIAIFCSGKGSNFKSLYYSLSIRNIPARIVLCISNNPYCGAIAFAKEVQIETFAHQPNHVFNNIAFHKSALMILQKREVDIILLAGYLKKIPPFIIECYKNKILNIHPSLLPKFGGKGMYGIHVHKAVIKASETTSGATIHFVNEHFDKGNILIQASIPVLPNETPEGLSSRISIIEHQLYPAGVEFALSNLYPKNI